MNDSGKTNLLIDSLSDDSEDVPDLQLIPPVKTKKKKLRKVNVPKWPNRSKLEEETADSFGSNEIRRFPRLWTCSLTFTLLSLVIGLILCSWFCMRLYKEVEILKNDLNVSSIEFKEKIKSIEDRLLFTISQTERTRPTSVGASFKPLPLNTMQDVNNSMVTLQKMYTSLSSDLEMIKEQMQNVSRFEEAMKENNYNLTDNKVIQDLQNNVNFLMENCTKSSPPSLYVPNSPGPPADQGTAQGTAQTTQTSGRP